VLEDDGVRVVLTDEPYTPLGLTIGKTYRFEVQATAEGAKGVNKTFNVIIGDTYDAIRIRA
jgi:hypothetical protein